jgi:hypothetical protein
MPNMAAKFLSWDDVKPKTNKSGTGGAYTQDGVEFLKLEVNKEYRLRLVGPIVEYLQHWSPIACRSPEHNKTCEEIIDPILQLGLQTEYPKPRYSMWVFDRNDGSKLKVIDFSGPMKDKFVAWKTKFNDSPSGENGPDWSIEGVCPGTDKRKTKWECMNLDRTPWTAEEKATLKAANLKEKLEKVRSAHTPDQIREMLAKKNIATSAEKVPSSPKQATNSPAGSATNSSVKSTVVADAGASEEFNF